jgi:hypothetical protein
MGAPEPVKVLVFDVKEARLKGHNDEETWACIEHPQDDYDEGMCGTLQTWLAKRHQARREEDHTAKMCTAGFVGGVAVPNVFHRSKWDVCIVAHGDDSRRHGSSDILISSELDGRVVYHDCQERACAS